MTAKRDKGKRFLFLKALDTAASGNAQAFGFSILITVSYGIVSTSVPPPSMGELLGFAMAAVAAFSLLNLCVAWFAGRESGTPETERVLLIATATDFIAVAAGLGAAYGIGLVVEGWAVWVLTPFVAGLTYLLVQTLEIMGGRMDFDSS